MGVEKEEVEGGKEGKTKGKEGRKEETGKCLENKRQETDKSQKHQSVLCFVQIFNEFIILPFK